MGGGMAHRSSSDRAGGPNGPEPATQSQPKALIPCAFAFGDEQWPGIAKLVEECGEVLQIVGKLMMTHGDRAHWSGDLRPQFVDELADLCAAATFVMQRCLTVEEGRYCMDRQRAKIHKFFDWHADMDADPPPPLETP